MRSIADILSMTTLDGVPTDEAMGAIARLTDYAFDKGDLGLTSKALDWCDQLEPHLSSAEQCGELDYFRANAWAHRQTAKRSDRAAAWEWDQEELQQQIYFLRRALNSSAFEQLHVLRKCQILTNLANQLDTVGRFVEARELWRKALELQPQFWMARGNGGRGLMHYAQSLYDPGHAAVFALAAHRELTEAVRDIDQHPTWGDASLSSYFQEFADSIEYRFDLAEIAKHYRPDQFSVGEEEDERAYRMWCLREVMFLNPLNNLHSSPIAARDVLTLPSFVTPLREPPVLIGFFNQIKQEYVSARWLYFEGINAKTLHMSDRDVLLYNTLDYPAFGLAIEKIKIAFRMAYSLLDKIAYFLNRYLRLGIPEKGISFRHIWRHKDSGPVRNEFSSSENWPFRGLYWLSKDLFEKDFKEMTEPDARALHDLRNHLEHKYVKVRLMEIPDVIADRPEPGLFSDTVAYSISLQVLERKTLRILKLARSALIYLSLGMHTEEARRRAADDPDAIIPSIALTELDDAFKVRW